MNFRFAKYVLVFCLTLSVCACESASERAAKEKVKASVINNAPSVSKMPPLPNENLEDFGWTKFDGKRQKLGEMKGKVVVLDFWATYCPPCLDEIPHLVELQTTYKAEGLEIVGLHVGGDEDKPKVAPFVAKFQMNYTLAYPDDKLSNALQNGDDRIPQTFVLDRKGNLVKQIVGFDENIKKELDDAINEALKK